MDPDISKQHRALGGVPRKPAIGQAVEQQITRPVAAGQPIQMGFEPRQSRGVRCADADIGQPDAAGDLPLGLRLLPATAGKRAALQSLDEDRDDTALRQQRLYGRGVDRLCPGDAVGRGGAVVGQAVALRLRHAGGEGWGGEGEGEEERSESWEVSPPPALPPP